MSNQYFHPDHFYSLALMLNDKKNDISQECSCEHKECILRTIIDRSYYAAFLHAKDWLYNEKGFEPNNNGSDHSRVRISLENHEMWHLSNKLFELHGKRKDASYDTIMIIDEICVDDSLELSKSVITSLR